MGALNCYDFLGGNAMSDMSAMINLIKVNPTLISEIGDCPNIEFPTVGGKVFWKDIKTYNAWRLQHNYITGYTRILDDHDIRKAWGSQSVMEEKFKRLTRRDFLEPGDIVGVFRKRAFNLYEHYAVYIGDEKVVHYSGSLDDFNGGVVVRMDTFQNFLKSDKNYFVVHFDKTTFLPHKIHAKTSFNTCDMDCIGSLKLNKQKEFKLYSPEETVRRALSRIGEDKYSLLQNNCEHFAVWCKTGVSESFQVDRAIYRRLMI